MIMVMKFMMVMRMGTLMMIMTVMAIASLNVKIEMIMMIT